MLFYLFLGLLVLFLVLLGLFFFYLYYWQIQRAMPQLSGELRLSGLTAPVEVRRDKHGVPHIYAQNRADLFRAQGFVHAQDRFWQMEQNRRVASGRLAEVFGEAALHADRFSRIIGFRRAAQAELAQIDAETRQVLDCYAEGVNVYLQSRPRRVAAELNLLRIEPEDWTALDTLACAKVMAWGLSLNWESELLRLQLLQQFDPYTAADLEPDYPEKAPIILEGVGSHEQTRAIYTAGLLLNQYENARPWLGNPGLGQGSNSWVLAPKHSLNGRPLLCNDPHMTVAIPNFWYENHLVSPDYEVSGASLPGLPAVIIGHNESIAWGFTNAQVDTQDLYIERAHPNDVALFEYNGNWEKAQIYAETILVRRGQPHIEKVVVTRHGPLISNFAVNANLPLALRWAGHDPSHTLRALLKLNQAGNWQEFDAALADWGTPVQNATYADERGYIGYLMCGRAPRREQNPGLIPAPGWNDVHEWTGMIPHAEAPRLFQPASGKIVTANNKIVGDDYPHFLGIEFFPGFRAARIEEMLCERERYTIRDMEAIQLDTGSKFAEALTPWITHLQTDDPWERAAIQELRRWKFRMDGDSAAALAFHAILLELLDLTFGDKLGAVKDGYLGISSTPLFLTHGFMTRAEVRLLELLNSQEQSRWYMEAATGRQRTREQLLQEAMTRAMKTIRFEIGEVTTRWQWARAHQVRYVHPLGSARFVGRFFNRGPLAIGGDPYSPNQTRHASKKPLGLVQVIANYRQILEVGAWDRCESVMPTGQSGHPLSDDYDNQLYMWKEGQYHKVAWSRPVVEEATQHLLWLKV
jgi:penicillin amidase